MNPYDVLGVEKNASDDDIKKAFRKAAHKHHPDKDGGDEAKFKEINEAYQILSNKEKRAQYDQFGQTFDGAAGAGAGGAGGQGFGGFDFSQFTQQGGQAGGFEFDFGGGGGFADMFGGGRQRARGRDIQVGVRITFDEMIHGTTKDITLHKDVVCEHCKGTGGEPGAKEKTCTTCNGQGSVEKVMRTMLGNFAQRVVCADCHGKGKTYDKQCTVCRGKGRVKKDVTEHIEIPAGINNGQTISLSTKGEAGENGAPAGDLLIVVEVEPDARFVREGNNINSEIHITFPQAALGDKVSVETVEGPVKMKIPAGTQSGEVFRIRGKGVPRLQGIGRGDHMVKVIVDVPTKLTKEQKKLIQELAQTL